MIVCYAQLICEMHFYMFKKDFSFSTHNMREHSQYNVKSTSVLLSATFYTLRCLTCLTTKVIIMLVNTFVQIHFANYFLKKHF